MQQEADKLVGSHICYRVYQKSCSIPKVLLKDYTWAQ